MAFELRPLDDGPWGVFDDEGQLRWSGSLRDCEDWLDQQENLARGHGRSLPGRLLDWLLRRERPANSGSLGR